MSKLNFLLEKLKILHMKYEKLNENNSDKFNIFSILLKSSDEVNLHSKFIYELINPKGSHQQHETFLNLFIQEINSEKSEKITIEPLMAYREKNNIDILLKSKNQAIIIENKIYTEDHSNQLSKYLTLIKKEGYSKEKISLIYLTLFNEEPNEKKVKDIVINITYETNIKNWIELCIKEVAMIPTLRETLVQYLMLINKLTNQSQNKGYLMEIKDILLKDDNLKLALDMQEAIKEAKIELQLKFWESLLNNLKNRGYDFSFYDSNSSKNLKKAITKYYEKRKNIRHYGIKYSIDKNLEVYVEINHQIYFGFSTFNEHDIKPFKIGELNIQWDDSGKWYYLNFPTKQLNFEAFNNQNILDLVNEETREHDINIIADDIVNLIDIYKSGTSI